MATAIKTDREELIQRLREYGAQQAAAEQQADRGSLDRAQDLMELYEEKSWVDEIPAPGLRSRVPADDFRRFTKWAAEGDRLGLRRKQISALHMAHEVLQFLPRAEGVADATERSIRPLRWLLNNGYSGHIPEVWRSAVQLAEGASPSQSQVRRALSDWKLHTFGKAKRGAVAKGAPAKVRALRDEALRWGREAPTLTIPMLRDVLATLEAEAEAVPPVETW